MAQPDGVDYEDDFFEEDEPLDKLLAAFDRGEKGVTAPPVTGRMPGRVSPRWCPVCHAPPGPDCPVRSRSGKQVRAALKRELRTLNEL